MSRYDPICEVCHRRPKMDRCGCCEECWYSGAYADAVSFQRMTPSERRREMADYRWLAQIRWAADA